MMCGCGQGACLPRCLTPLFRLFIGTDILPAELPKESSEHFGNAVVKVLDELVESRAAAANPTMDLKDGPPILVRSLCHVFAYNIENFRNREYLSIQTNEGAPCVSFSTSPMRVSQHPTALSQSNTNTWTPSCKFTHPIFQNARRPWRYCWLDTCKRNGQASCLFEPVCLFHYLLSPFGSTVPTTRC